jgi:hypothetical protein
VHNCRRLVEGMVPEGKTSLKGSDLCCRVGHKKHALSSIIPRNSSLRVALRRSRAMKAYECAWSCSLLGYAGFIRQGHQMR